MRFASLPITSLTCLALFAGCASILGDFTTSGTAGGDAGGDSLPPPPDASGVDGAMGDSPGAADGAESGPNAPPVLKCDGWMTPKHVLVDKLDTAPAGQRSFNNRISIVNGGPSMGVRIVAQAGGGGGSFNVYSFNPNDTNNIVKTAVPISGNVNDVQRVSDGVGVAGPNTAAGAPVTSLTLWDIADSLGSGMTPSPTSLSKPGGIQPDTVSDAFVEIKPGDFFYLASYRASQNPDVYSVQIGRPADATWSDVGTSSTRVDFIPQLYTDGATVYAFLGTDPTKGGSTITSFPATAQATSYTARPVSGTKNAFTAAVGAAASAPGKVNLAFGELDTTATTNPFDWRVGQVSAAALPTFMVTDLTLGSTYDDIAKVPVNNGDSRWIGDNFVVIGGGPAGGAGFNFAWYDAAGRVRAEQVGAARLLTDRMGTVAASATMGQTIAVKFATFYVAWTETATDMAGVAYDAIYFDQLGCH